MTRKNLVEAFVTAVVIGIFLLAIAAVVVCSAALIWADSPAWMNAVYLVGIFSALEMLRPCRSHTHA